MATQKRRWFFIWICFLSISAGFSQTVTPQEWGRQLQRELPNEQERAYAIYHWLTRNISYDWDAYYAPRNPDQSPEAVLQRRKAVCEGFAALYQLLARAAGLECFQVRGIVKGVHFEIGDEIDRPNHVWNAVRINGKWELVDATWGAGDGKQQMPNDTYFMLSPEEFIFTHFPEEERWQLLDQPISLHAFERKPIVYPIFSELQPQLLHNADELIIETKRDSFHIHLRTLPTAVLMAIVADAKGNQREISENYRDRIGNIRIPIGNLRKGESYRLDIFAAASDTANELRQMLTYFINYGGNARYTTQANSRVRMDSTTAMPTGFVQDYVELQRKKDYQGALALLYDYATRYNTNVWLHTAIGENLEQTGKAEAAEASYLKALGLQKDYYRANYNLGVLYYNRAVRLNESLRQMKPDERQAKSDAINEQVRDWFAKARPYLQTALQKRPDNQQIQQALQQIQRVLK
ncbi:transglutaminase domain-containing protein [Rhodoflexus sp.]